MILHIYKGVLPGKIDTREAHLNPIEVDPLLTAMTLVSS